MVVLGLDLGKEKRRERDGPGQRRRRRLGDRYLTCKFTPWAARAVLLSGLACRAYMRRGSAKVGSQYICITSIRRSTPRNIDTTIIPASLCVLVYVYFSLFFFLDFSFLFFFWVWRCKVVDIFHFDLCFFYFTPIGANWCLLFLRLWMGFRFVCVCLTCFSPFSPTETQSRIRNE